MAKHRDLSALEYQSLLDVQTEGMSAEDKYDFLARWEKHTLEFRGNNEILNVVNIDEYRQGMYGPEVFVTLRTHHGPIETVVYVRDLYAVISA